MIVLTEFDCTWKIPTTCLLNCLIHNFFNIFIFFGNTVHFISHDEICLKLSIHTWLPLNYFLKTKKHSNNKKIWLLQKTKQILNCQKDFKYLWTVRPLLKVSLLIRISTCMSTTKLRQTSDFPLPDVSSPENFSSILRSRRKKSFFKFCSEMPGV